MSQKRVTLRPGVRCRIHETRKHGINFDRYFIIYYRFQDKNFEEGLGWQSKGWTEKKAAGILSELQENQRRGEPPFSLREKREMEKQTRKAREEKEAEQERAALTFGELFKKHYLPHIKQNRRNNETHINEEILFRLWACPIIGKKPLAEIAPIHLEKIKNNMLKAGRAPRTARYALEMVRQVFNYALRNGHYSGVNPVSKVTLPKVGNRRMRFLTQEEAEALLTDLGKRSTETRDMAALSLYAGLRFGEITSLQWGDVDIERGILLLRDTKSGKTRAAFMNAEVKKIFNARTRGKPTEYVFKDLKHGGRIGKISHSFWRAVDELKLNEGIEDPRQKVVFHSLRHSFASWLVEAGADLYTVKELLGHADYSMAARYSHVGAETLRAAVNKLTKPQEAPKLIELKK